VTKLPVSLNGYRATTRVVIESAPESTVNCREETEVSTQWGTTVETATDENITKLTMCHTCWVDRTFIKCVPSLFIQLYTIHWEINDFIVPLVFVLLLDKQTATYQRMFECLNSYTKVYLVFSMQPTELPMDCETAVVSVTRIWWQLVFMQNVDKISVTH